MYQNPIKINLMPHREALKESRKKVFFTRAILVAALAAVLMFFAWQLINQYIDAQQERNNFITSEIKKLDAEIAQIATLQAEIDALKARQAAVENLQSDRNLPIYVFQELNSFIPDGIVLRAIKQDAKKIMISGFAQTQERVSEVLRNFTNSSVWLEKPELVEIKLSSLNLFNNGKSAEKIDKIYEFTISVLVKRAEKKTAKTIVATTNNIPAINIPAVSPVSPQQSLPPALPSISPSGLTNNNVINSSNSSSNNHVVIPGQSSNSNISSIQPSPNINNKKP